MTSLPAVVHRRLRTVAVERDVYKSDIVLAAVATHENALRRAHDAELGRRGGLARGRQRRRSVEDPTQCQLYFTDEERRFVDDLAAALELSRSDLVTRALELEFDATAE